MVVYLRLQLSSSTKQLYFLRWEQTNFLPLRLSSFSSSGSFRHFKQLSHWIHFSTSSFSFLDVADSLPDFEIFLATIFLDFEAPEEVLGFSLTFLAFLACRVLVCFLVSTPIYFFFEEAFSILTPHLLALDLAVEGAVERCDILPLGLLSSKEASPSSVVSSPRKSIVFLKFLTTGLFLILLSSGERENTLDEIGIKYLLVDSNIVRWAFASCTTWKDIKPVEGGKIDSFSDVEAVVEAAVVSSRQSDDKLVLSLNDPEVRK